MELWPVLPSLAWRSHPVLRFGNPSFRYPWAAYLTGILAAFAFYGVSRLLNTLRIDDAIDAVGVHAGGGVVGLLIKPFVAFNGGIFYGNEGNIGSEMLAWNVLGFLVIVTWTVLTTGVTFGALRLLGCLRVSDDILRSDFDRSESHQSIDMHEHGESAYTSHLIKTIDMNEGESAFTAHLVNASLKEGSVTMNATFEP
jgi:ammonia channel protein AmtB